MNRKNDRILKKNRRFAVFYDLKCNKKNWLPFWANWDKHWM